MYFLFNGQARKERIWEEVGLEWANFEILAGHLRKGAGLELRSRFGSKGEKGRARRGRARVREGKDAMKRGSTSINLFC